MSSPPYPMGPGQRSYFARSNTNSASSLLPHSQEQDMPRGQLLSPRPSINSGFQPSSAKPRNVATLSSVSGQDTGRYNLPLGSKTNSITHSISDKYSLAPDPYAWGSNISSSQPEPDDDLHNPNPRRDRMSDIGGTVLTYRGLTNVGCLLLLGVGLLALFAGYPMISHFTAREQSMNGGFNFGGINASGQVPDMPGNWGLIDKDTPREAYSKPSYTNPGEDLELVFSDEFNTDGRTFYPGEDPYWEAVDLHYWATNNLEWYDPAAVTTKDGSLEITLSRKQTHDLTYEGGMITTWNKFCFTGGILEASVQLPGANNVAGLWPAVWALGNLGRAGYGATLDGLWPYTYDSCDVGTAANQSHNGLPPADVLLVGDDPDNQQALSFLPGQRLSRCTCRGESHPGPIHRDGTYVGRSAPEIDVLEAQITGTPLTGQVSQSAQWAPFNARYEWTNNSETLVIYDPNVSILNTYKGASYQQATSVVSETDQNCYERSLNPCFSTYGFEYKPGFDDAYITWISDNKLAWTFRSGGTGPDPLVGIAARPVPQEPMYLLLNLGISLNFGDVDFEHLVFPTKMKLDWIRVYQPSGAPNIGCDPKEFPTKAYIDQYIEAYTNPNFTTWVDDFKQPWPKSSLLGQC